MTVSLATGVPGSRTTGSAKPSTRSAAMMALTLGKHKSSAPCTKPIKQTTTTDRPQLDASPSSPNRTSSTITSKTQRSPVASRPTITNVNDVFPSGGGCSGNSSGSDCDGLNTSNSSSTSTALRRLYFKSGRKNKINNSMITPSNNIPLNVVSNFTHAYHTSVSDGLPPVASTTNGVPKVIIMGSSSASTTDTNINTSTDSASTLITNVTHTDTSETCDSLDMVETSCQSETLFSSLEEPLLTAIQVDSEHDAGAELELTSCSRYPRPEMSLQESTESQESCLSILTGEHLSTKPLLSSHRRHNMPRTSIDDIEPIPNTAPPPSSNAKHFSFDMPKSPKSADTSGKYHKHFTFRESTATGNNGTAVAADSCFSPKRDARMRSPITTPAASNSSKINSAPPTTKNFTFFGSNSSGLKAKSYSPAAQQRKYSSSSSSGGSEREHSHRDGTMFPFDREALDLQRVQKECFAVHENSSSVTASSDSDDAEQRTVHERKRVGASAYGCNGTLKTPDIFQQYTLLSQKEQLQQQQKQHDTSGRLPSRKNSKRIRPDSVIHSTIQENQQYVRCTDAFYPQQMSSSSPSDQSFIELNKFDDIAKKFEQIPSKHSLANADSITNLNCNTNATDYQSNLPSQDTTKLTRKRSPRKKCSKTPNSETTAHDPLKDQKSPLQLQQSAQYAATTDAGSSSGGSINVTSNPMDAAVCTQPRATIVVQQPSLTLDNTVETMLIKNEGDFISVEQGKDSAGRLHNSHQYPYPMTAHHQQKQRRDENIRQLLDVTNTLTIEELRDFEMRYGSPHHSRSQSVKTPGSRSSGRPNQLSLPQQRARVASMPNTGVEEEYYRLRHFSITGKGVINRGDSLKSRRSRSNNSVASSNSSTEHLTTTQIPAPTSARTSATCSLASSRESSTSNPGNGPYRVLMLGGPAVGKSSLVSQFMTSEYLHAYDTSIDDDSGEKSVSVLLSGEESELIFIDHPYTEMMPDDCLSSYDPHGYCVIYSSSDRSSFNVAEHVLQVLWTNQNIAQKAVILVGNKADLARSRLVTSEEGKAMATAYDCKFIETSVGINHNVDELLVGLLSQIRLKLENPEKSRDLFRKRSIRKSKRRACSPLGGICLNPNTPLGPTNNVIGNTSSTPGSTQSSPRKYRGSRTSTSLKVKGLLGRVWARDSKSKSCENLHVL